MPYFCNKFHFRRLHRIVLWKRQMCLEEASFAVRQHSTLIAEQNWIKAIMEMYKFYSSSWRQVVLWFIHVYLHQTVQVVLNCASNCLQDSTLKWPVIHGSTGYSVVSGYGQITSHFSLSSSGSWQLSNWIIKPDNFTYLLWRITSADSFAAFWIWIRTSQAQTCDSTHSLGVQVKLVLPKLLSTHSDGVVDSTQLSMCLTILTSISSIRWFLVLAR